MNTRLRLFFALSVGVLGTQVLFGMPDEEYESEYGASPQLKVQHQKKFDEIAKTYWSLYNSCLTSGKIVNDRELVQFQQIVGKSGLPQKSEEYKYVQGMWKFVSLYNLHNKIVSLPSLFVKDLNARLRIIKLFHKSYKEVYSQSYMYSSNQKELLTNLNLMVSHEKLVTQKNIDRLSKHVTQNKKIDSLLANKLLEQKNRAMQLSILIYDKADLSKIKQLLAQKIDIFFQCPEGRTALHVALLQKPVNLSVVELLINSGSSCALQDKQGNSPLHIACEKGLVDVVKCMLSQEVVSDSISIVDSKKLDSGRHAIQVDQNIRLDFCHDIELNAKNKREQTPFFLACKSGNLQLIQFLLGFNQIDALQKDLNGSNVLMDAVRRGDFAMFYLVGNARKFDLGDTDNLGRTIAHYLTMSGDLECVQNVLDTISIDLNAVDNKKKSPLDTYFERVLNSETDPTIILLLNTRGASFKKFANDEANNTLLQIFRTSIDQSLAVQELSDEDKDNIVIDFVENLRRGDERKALAILKNNPFLYSKVYYTQLANSPSSGKIVQKSLLAHTIDLALQGKVKVFNEFVALAKDTLKESCLLVWNKKNEYDVFCTQPVQYALSLVNKYDEKHIADSIELLCQHGALIDIEYFTDLKSGSDESVLHGIIENDYPSKIVEVVIKYSQVAFINRKRASDGLSALHAAVMKNKPKYIKLMGEKKGIKLNLKDRKGNTPLYYATHVFKIDCSKALLEIYRATEDSKKDCNDINLYLLLLDLSEPSKFRNLEVSLQNFLSICAVFLRIEGNKNGALKELSKVKSVYTLFKKEEERLPKIDIYSILRQIREFYDS